MPRKALEELREHLENEQVTDDAQRDRLNALKQRVDQAIDDTESHPQLLRELEEASVLFGDDHPQLAAAIRAAIDILGEGGI